jgi:hypothetical protein
MKPADPALQSIIGQLVETLQEEVRQNQRLVRIVRRKKVTLLREAQNELDSVLRAEREVLTDVATIERDRIQIVAQLGEVLGHPQPSRLRIAELVLHAEPEHRDELLDIREELRDLADELDDLNSVEPLFTRHRQDNVRLFVSPSRWKRGLLAEKGAQDDGAEAGAEAVHDHDAAH